MDLRPTDVKFSQYIRKRDKRCVRCGKPAEVDPLQCSHFHGRSQEATRFDPDNCDALCNACHQYWEHDGRAEYERWKRYQLGEERFAALSVRAESYRARDDQADMQHIKMLMLTLTNTYF